MKKQLRALGAKARAHKIATSAIVVVVLIAASIAWGRSGATGERAQYVVSPISIGSVTQTVSGSGQVSAANQLDVTSKASGQISSIAVRVGDHVSKGQLLATIDTTTARSQLESAEISYDKIVAPPKPEDVESAADALDKSYSDAWSAVRSSFTDLKTVVDGMDAMLYEQNGFFGPGRSAFLTTTAQSHRMTAGSSFDAAKAAYARAVVDYARMSESPATSSIEQMSTETYGVLELLATSLQNLQNAVNFVTTNQPDYNSNLASSAESSVASWISTVNGDVSSNASARNSIAAARNAYSDLMNGPDELDLASAQLSLRQAQQAYSDYFVRAPFAGAVGRIPASVYSQAGGSTVIATLVGDEKIATISLDEVDAAKVAVGQKASISFDALPELVATGTVEEVDLVGTVSGGVVSYNVKIGIGTEDSRIRPGMSLSVSIVTAEKDGVLVVPSPAVKSQNGRSYVETVSAAAMEPYLSARPSGSFATTTRAIGTTTRAFSGAGGSNGAGAAARQPSVTIPATAATERIPVTVGLSDDTNTEIESGLAPREWVVVRSVSSSAAQATTPSLFSAIGGRAAGTGNAARTGGAARPAVRIGG